MVIQEGLYIAYFTYLVGTASPGPANLAIMQASLEKGRTIGLAVAAGVVTGSVFWGGLVAIGLGSVITDTPGLLHMLSLFGGGYLLWLCYSNMKKWASSSFPQISTVNDKPYPKEIVKNYILGLMIHLTNPKAVFVWLAIILLASTDGHYETNTSYWVVFGCGLLGIIVFCGYALLFSNTKMVMIYSHMRRPFTMTVALLFFTMGSVLIYQALLFL
jgi:threonine/homoserine/homoserine lactone efflux protein